MTNYRLKKIAVSQTYWQLFITVSLLIPNLFVPFKLTTSIESSQTFAITDLLLSFFYLAESISSFYILKRQKNSLYQKNILFFELLAIIPFEALAFYMQLPELFSALTLIKMVRFYRPLKILYLAESTASLPNKVKFPLIIGLVHTTLHWIACFWMLIYPQPELDTWTFYNKSMYWVVTTLTTIGYGDITPTTNLGRVYTMCVMILGVGLYGIVISNMTQLLSRSDKHKQAVREKIKDLSMLMSHYEIPKELQEQVYEFYGHLISKKMGNEDEKIIADMPSALKKELSIYMNFKLIQNVPLFEKAGFECLKDISKSLERSYYSPGDFIIKKGEVGNEMFLIGHGQVDIKIDQDTTIATLSDGQFFGEIALLEEAVRNADVRAKTYCDLYKLRKSDFLDILDKYPQLQKIVHKVKEERLKKAA